MTADRTVSVELLARVSGYTSGMAAAAKATDDTAASMSAAAKAQTQLEAAQKKATAATAGLSKSQAAQAAASRKQLDALTTVGKGFLFMGAAAGIGLGAAVSATIKFDAELATLQALVRGTPADMAKLSNAALTVGQRYGFTATQVVQAEQELAKAGVSVSNIVGGALVGSLTLASAAQTNVATATELAVSAMTQFGLKGKDVPHIADLLAAGADKALGSAVDLGDGLRQVGTTAHQFGFSIEDTVGTLAEFANAGQLGQRAGTELNQALLQLAAPTKQAQVLMDKYGFSLYNAQGHVKTFAQLADNLNQSFGTLTPQVRNQALAVIFGSRAIRAANILLADGADKNRQWVAAVNDAGFAAQQASGKLDSLGGDLTKLHAAFQTGLIETGQQAAGSLRLVVQGITDVIEWYDKLGPVSKTVIFDTTAIVTVTGLVGGAALIAIPKIVAFQAALATLRGTALSTAAALDAEATAEVAAGGAAGAGGAGAAVGAGRGLLGGIAAGAGAAGPAAAVLAVAAGGAIAISAEIAHAQSITQKQIDELTKSPAKLAAAQTQLAALQKQASQGVFASGSAGKGANAANSSFIASGSQISHLKTVIDGATAALKAQDNQQVQNAKSTDQWVASLQVVGRTVVTTSLDLTTLNADLTSLGHAFDVRTNTDKLTEGFKALAKQIKANGAATKGNSDAALANRDALTQQYQVALSIIQAYAATGKTADQVKAKTKAVTDQFITQATHAGLTKKQIQNYIDALHRVPAVVNSNVQTTGLTAAVKQVIALTNYLNAIKGKSFAVQVNAQVNFQGGANLPGVGILAPGRGGVLAPGGYTGGTFRGGWFDRYSDGGSVFGGPPGRDTNFARLDNGEEVIRKGPAAAFRPLLKAINNAPGFAAGGTVGSPNLSDIFSLLQVTNSKGKSIVSSLGAQFSTATAKTDRTDGAFIANLEKLAAKGFGFLAMQLLESGDQNAKYVAAQAVRWSSSHLRVVQSGLERSAAQQKQLGLLPAELAISSALRTGKNPTLASIAAATGLDPSDLQAGLIAMQKSLRGNKNAGALLRGLNSTGIYSTTNWGASTASSGPLFQIIMQEPVSNPYSVGEKIAMGGQRVLAVSSGSNQLPRW